MAEDSQGEPTVPGSERIDTAKIKRIQTMAKVSLVNIQNDPEKALDTGRLALLTYRLTMEVQRFNQAPHERVVEQYPEIAERLYRDVKNMSDEQLERSWQSSVGLVDPKQYLSQHFPDAITFDSDKPAIDGSRLMAKWMERAQATGSAASRGA